MAPEKLGSGYGRGHVTSVFPTFLTLSRKCVPLSVLCRNNGACSFKRYYGLKPTFEWGVSWSRAPPTHVPPRTQHGLLRSSSSGYGGVTCSCQETHFVLVTQYLTFDQEINKLQEGSGEKEEERGAGLGP